MGSIAFPQGRIQNFWLRGATWLGGQCHQLVTQNTGDLFSGHRLRRHSLKLVLVGQFTQDRINRSGAPYQRKVGALFSYAYPRIFPLEMHFSSPKNLTSFFSRPFKPTLHVQTSTQRGKNLAVYLGAPDGGGPSHGTTGTMVNPALYTL